MNRYSRLAYDPGGGDRFRLARIEGDVWLIDGRPNPNDSPEVTESALARMVCGVRRRLGDAPFVKAIHVTHPEPPYRAEYDRIFRLAVVFESDQNAVLLSNEFFEAARGVMPSPYVSAVLKAHAEAQLEKLQSTTSFRGRVESLLLPVLHTGQATVDHVATELGLSRQTLFRKLKAEGVTFEKVLDELRHKMALRYLNGKNVSVNETAYRLGFSDPAAFSRAFKRWTGSSPSTMRAKTKKE